MNEFDNIIAKFKDLLEALLSGEKIPFDESMHSLLSKNGGVYRICEIGSSCYESVYVGKSGNLQNRIHGNHLMGNRRASTLKRKLIKRDKYKNENAVKQYLKQKCVVQFLIVSDELDRTGFEHFAVAVLQPRYND